MSAFHRRTGHQSTHGRLPSPHIAEPRAAHTAGDPPIHLRLHGAVARVMPAIETTLATLAAGPLQPRQMELAARALGSLTRTLRELNVLLEQHAPPEPERDVEELRRSVARKLDAAIRSHQEDMPRRYLEAWEDFAAEAEAGNTGLEADAPVH